MFKYSMYNYLIESNVPCKYLTPAITGIVYDKSKTIKVHITEASIQTTISNTCHTYKCDDEQMKGIWKNILYCITFSKMLIEIQCERINDGYLFLLNMPIALLIAFNGDLILHSSCAIINENIYCFCGSKGAGKSTTAVLLSSLFNNTILFSDDTICIDVKSGMVYSNYYVQKYTENTMRLFQKNNGIDKVPLDYRNEKYIIRSTYLGGPKSLSRLRIFYVFQGAEHTFKVIENDHVKLDFLERNIVGYKYAHAELKSIMKGNVEIIINNFDLKHVILHIPEYSNFSVDELRKIFKNIINLK